MDGLASEKKPCQLSVFLFELMRVFSGLHWLVFNYNPLVRGVGQLASRGKASQILVRVAERKSHSKVCRNFSESRDVQTLEMDINGLSDKGGSCWTAWSQMSFLYMLSRCCSSFPW